MGLAVHLEILPCHDPVLVFLISTLLQRFHQLFHLFRIIVKMTVSVLRVHELLPDKHVEFTRALLNFFAEIDLSLWEGSCELFSDAGGSLFASSASVDDFEIDCFFCPAARRCEEES